MKLHQFLYHFHWVRLQLVYQIWLDFYFFLGVYSSKLGYFLHCHLIHFLLLFGINFTRNEYWKVKFFMTVHYSAPFLAIINGFYLCLILYSNLAVNEIAFLLQTIHKYLLIKFYSYTKNFKNNIKFSKLYYY